MVNAHTRGRRRLCTTAKATGVMETAPGAQLCRHPYCKPCLLIWAHTCTSAARPPTCPSCRGVFSYVTELRGGPDARLAVGAAAAAEDQDLEPPPQEERDPVDDVVCAVCGDGGDEALLLLCSRWPGCPGAAHQYCVGLGRAPLPEQFVFRCSASAPPPACRCPTACCNCGARPGRSARPPVKRRSGAGNCHRG